MTGSTSVHTHYEGHEIMFHVSTMLPFSDDPQQVRKRFLFINGPSGKRRFYTYNDYRGTVMIMIRCKKTRLFLPQVERKRHIGNDIVNIVFQECESHEKPTFTPYGIRSQFTRIL